MDLNENEFEFPCHDLVKNDIDLKHKVEILEIEMKYKDQIAQKELESIEHKKEREKLELEKSLQYQHSQEKLAMIEETQKMLVSCTNYEYPYQGNNSKSEEKTLNHRNPSKRTELNNYFSDMIDMDTFIENFKDKYALTFEESRTLLEYYKECGVKSYGMGLFSFLKKKCCKQIEDLTGNTPETVIMPFVLSDGSLRTHLEKTVEGWINTNSIDKIKRIVIISNDQIYKHHNEYIPLTSHERHYVANSLLKKSDYLPIEVSIKKRKNLELEFDSI